MAVWVLWPPACGQLVCGRHVPCAPPLCPPLSLLAASWQQAHSQEKPGAHWQGAASSAPLAAPPRMASRGLRMPALASARPDADEVPDQATRTSGAATQRGSQGCLEPCAARGWCAAAVASSGARGGQRRAEASRGARRMPQPSITARRRRLTGDEDAGAAGDGAGGGRGHVAQQRGEHLAPRVVRVHCREQHGQGAHVAGDEAQHTRGSPAEQARAGRGRRRGGRSGGRTHRARTAPRRPGGAGSLSCRRAAALRPARRGSGEHCSSTSRVPKAEPGAP